MKLSRGLTPARLFFGAFWLITIFRLVYTTLIPLTGDEAYHWEWSRHLAFGYYDHPPLIAWLMAFFTAIGGSALFWVRLTAVLAVAGTTYLTYRMGREMGGEQVGLTAGWFSLAAPAMMLGSVIATTDSPLIFCWQLTLYLVWRALSTRRGVYWYWAGIALGFGLLSKFLIIPLVGGIGLFLTLSREDRFWLRRKEPYLGLLFAGIIFLPFLLWNSQHGWTSFVFQLTRHYQSINWLRPWEFLGMQFLLILSPVLYAGALWSFWRQWRRLAGWTKNAASEKEAARRRTLLVLLTGWLFPAFLFIDSIRNQTSAHWPVAAYGMILIGLALELRYLASTGENKKLKPLGLSCLITAAIWTVLTVTLTLNPELLRGVTVRGYGVNEAFGWEEIGREVDALQRRTGAALIATSSYTFSSMVSFYTPDKLYLGVLGPGSRHGRAYDLWDRWERRTGKNVLFISEKDPRLPEGKGQRRILRDSFARFEFLREIPVRHKGITVRKIYACMGYDLKGDPYAAIRAKYRW